jgi:transposase
MGMFIKYLVSKLDEDRPGWRTDSIMMFDGASYHKSDKTIELLDSLQVPHLISSPYSYDCSPIELWFARLKDQDINPDKLKTSKSKYDYHIFMSQSFFPI